MVRMILLLAWLASAAAGVAAQDAALSRGAPRFLAARGAEGTVEIDPAAVSIFQRRVTLALEQTTVGDALAAVGKQTGIRIVYSRDVLNPEAPARIKADGITVAAALTEILFGAGVDVVLSSMNRVTLAPRKTGRVRVAGGITGKVSDAKSGEVLVGAEVFLEGTRWRANTGSDGRYRLAEVEPGTYTLAARRVGYGKQGRAVVVAEGAEVTVDIALQPVATQLNEIVTTVTGDQRRVELGHVVGRINADSLVKEAPVSSLSELLTARVPGLQVFQTQGTVGGRVDLQIRGLNSVNLNNQPIVVIDGVRYATAERLRMFTGSPGEVEPTSPLNDLNPNDIESIEVVKGPSAGTLYGTDAANGVLVITTKRGRPGPARWSAYAKSTITSIPEQHFRDIYWGWGTVSGVPSNPNSSCTLERLASRQCTQQDSVAVVPNPLNDPQYTIFRSKPRWEYGMNVAGGRQDLRYYFSGDIEDAAGPVQMPPAIAQRLMEARGLRELPEEWREPNAFTKMTLRSNVTATLGEKADLRFNTGYVRSATRTLSSAAVPYETGYSATPAGWEFPSAYDSPYGRASSNPAAAFARTTTERTDRFVGSAGGHGRPAPWLETRATVGLDFTSATRYGLARPGDQPGSTGLAEDTRTRQIATTVDLGVTASVRRGRLSARTAVGAQYTRSLDDASGSFGQGLPPGGSVVQAAVTIQSRQQYRETFVLGGYVEEMLGLNERLFLTGALRLDGASTFGRDYEAAAYPKVGASWLVSAEPLFPRLPGFDELRLRYAFGTSGKQPNPTWARPTLVVGQMGLNNQVVNKVSVSGVGNPDLGPERVREHEFGFDAVAFANRLTLDVTWFRRRTAGMIVSENGPPGRGLMFVNLGLVTQRGVEAQLKARVIDARFFSWDFTLQHADYTTRLLDNGGAAIYVEGYPLGARFDRPILGWEDVNGDGIIARSEIQLGDTAVYMGESVPPRTQTLTSVIGLFQGHLRLSTLLERKTGFTLRNLHGCRSSTCRAAVDPSTPFAEQVKALAPAGTLPEPGDFTRLREVTVALDLPTSLTRAVGLGRGTLALSARNLALWTGFSGSDPEVGDPGAANLESAVGIGSPRGIPQNRTLSFRLDLGF